MSPFSTEIAIGARRAAVPASASMAGVYFIDAARGADLPEGPVLASGRFAGHTMS